MRSAVAAASREWVTRMPMALAARMRSPSRSSTRVALAGRGCRSARRPVPGAADAPGRGRWPPAATRRPTTRAASWRRARPAHGVEHRRRCRRRPRLNRLATRRQGDVLLQGEVGQDVEGLEDETQLVPPPAGQRRFVEPAKVFAIEHDIALIGPVEPAMRLSSVDLPTPDSPTMATYSPRPDAAGAVQRRATVETSRQVGDFKHVRAGGLVGLLCGTECRLSRTKNRDRLPGAGATNQVSVAADRRILPCHAGHSRLARPMFLDDRRLADLILRRAAGRTGAALARRVAASRSTKGAAGRCRAQAKAQLHGFRHPPRFEQPGIRHLAQGGQPAANEMAVRVMVARLLHRSCRYGAR